MNKPGDTNPGYGVCETWTEALEEEGATQMKCLKKLLYRIYSQEVLSRVETVVLCRTIAASNVFRQHPMEFSTGDPEKEDITNQN